MRKQGQTEDETSCTLKLQKWNQPRKRRLDSQPSKEISFTVEQYDHKPCRISKEFFDPRPLNLQKTTDEELKTFTGNLQQLKISCGFLDLMVVSNNTASNLAHITQGVKGIASKKLI